MRSELWIDDIYGILTVPEKDEFPFVILVHGYQGTHKDNLNYADTMLEAGIGSYTFDFSTSMDECKSALNVSYSITTEMDQLNKVIKYFKNQKDLYLMGESLGGLVSALCADNRIKGLMLLYPAFNLKDISHGLFKSEEEIKDTIWLDAEVSKEFFKAIYHTNIMSLIVKYKGPVEIYHGDKDDIVPIEYSRNAIEVYEQASLVVFEGEGHNWYSPLSDRACEYMIEFIKKYSLL